MLVSLAKYTISLTEKAQFFILHIQPDIDFFKFYVLLINTFRISEVPYLLKIKNKYFGFSD